MEPTFHVLCVKPVNLHEDTVRIVDIALAATSVSIVIQLPEAFAHRLKYVREGFQASQSRAGTPAIAFKPSSQVGTIKSRVACSSSHLEKQRLHSTRVSWWAWGLRFRPYHQVLTPTRLCRVRLQVYPEAVLAPFVQACERQSVGCSTSHDAMEGGFTMGTLGMNKRIRLVSATGEEEEEPEDTWYDLRLAEQERLQKRGVGRLG